MQTADCVAIVGGLALRPRPASGCLEETLAGCPVVNPFTPLDLPRSLAFTVQRFTVQRFTASTESNTAERSPAGYSLTRAWPEAVGQDETNQHQPAPDPSDARASSASQHSAVCTLWMDTVNFQTKPAARQANAKTHQTNEENHMKLTKLDPFTLENGIDKSKG